jgi:arylsulfatase A-like enzyme
MQFSRPALAAIIAAAVVTGAIAAPKHEDKLAPARARNVIIFVADGLRYGSVTQQSAPTMWRIQHEGVDFQNSHSIYPTLTTANASAIATGHFLGDTGDYANTLYTGYPVAAHHNATVTFLEDDAILHDVKLHFGADYLGQTTLMQAARGHGMTTVVMGKVGPAAIQDLGALDGQSMLIDDAMNLPSNAEGLPTGSPALDPKLAAEIAKATGLPQPPLTNVPNVDQQKYLSTAAAKVVLPYLKNRGKPFALLFWSRDPDATQHAQQDSIGATNPGINGPTSLAAIANADATLKTLLDALQALGLSDSTDVFVTADHGFTTIVKSEPLPSGEPMPPHLPPGFLAVSIAQWLQMNLYDPDVGNALMDNAGEHPSRGDGIVGADPDHPAAVIAANGGSDLLWFPDASARAHAKVVFDQLIRQPYVSGIFVNDTLMDQGNAQDFAGALRMSDIGLIGASHVPPPSMVVNFRSYPIKGCTLDPLLCTAEIADTNLVAGQGMHGSFSRAETRNFMAAVGPDFKAHFADTAPISNADITPTLAHVLGLTLPRHGELEGRVVAEALKGGKLPVVSRKVLKSQPGPGGVQTEVEMQLVGRTRYFDAGGFAGRTVGLDSP